MIHCKGLGRQQVHTHKPHPGVSAPTAFMALLIVSASLPSCNTCALGRGIDCVRACGSKVSSGVKYIHFLCGISKASIWTRGNMAWRICPPMLPCATLFIIRYLDNNELDGDVAALGSLTKLRRLYVDTIWLTRTRNYAVHFGQGGFGSR